METSETALFVVALGSGCLLLLAVVVAVVVLVVRMSQGRQRRRDAELWHQWNRVRDYVQFAPGGEVPALGQVRWHRQRARSGLKAYVFWPATGDTAAAWFWDRWPPVGSFVLAGGQLGLGPAPRQGRLLRS